MSIEGSYVKIALSLLCPQNLLPQGCINTMYLLTILLWVSCASQAQVQANENCQVTTRIIGQITQLSYSLAVSNTSFEDDGSQAQRTSGLVVGSQIPSTIASPTQATLDCTTDVPGFDSLCGQRPGPESVIIHTLTKKNLFSYEDCTGACAMQEVCIGAAFQPVNGNCLLYSYILYLIPSQTFETFVKRSKPQSSPSSTTRIGAPSNSPAYTHSSGGQFQLTTRKAISTGLGIHQVSSTRLSSLAQGSNRITLLSPSSDEMSTGALPPTTVQSTAAQTMIGATTSDIPGHSTSASRLSPQSPPSSGLYSDSLPIIPFSTTLGIFPTSTSLGAQQTSSSAFKLVTSSSNLLPVSTSSIGSSSYDAGPSTTSSASPTVPTCYYRGYDDGTGNIGFYADAASGSFAGCDALCDANPSCLSFALETDTPACVLYNHTIFGYDLYSADSPFNFFLRGGGCPPMLTTTSPSSTSASPLPSPIFPVVSLTFTTKSL